MKEDAIEINVKLKMKSPVFFNSLSKLGKRLYMPKGIIFQSSQSTQHANKFNASIGIAIENIGFDGTNEIQAENLGPMVLSSLKSFFNDLEPNQIFNYAPPSGDMKVREFWQKKIIRQNPALSSIDQISLPVITGGLTHGLSIFSELFLNPNDTIVMADKMWENYNLMFNVKYQTKFIKYPLFKEDLSGFNLEAFENALKKVHKKKIIVLFNFPNNPTGYTATDNEMNAITDILKKFANKGKEIIVICDDAYYGLFYDAKIYPGSLFSKITNLHKNIVGVKVDGISKEDYAWGLRMGFITFTDGLTNKEAFTVLEQKATASIRSSISCASRISQSIFGKVMNSEKYQIEKNEKFDILQNRSNKVKEIVNKEEFKKYWDVYPFNSGYFMCLRIKDVSAEVVRTHALFKHGLGTIAFGNDLRVAFSCIEEKNIENVFKIIAKSIDEIKSGDIVSSL
ncbi:MAG: hypothetical protein A2015_16135 [Spirochaetes bacterium GWF1_31_7]|nr:MAG: hypothetical protein A2Y30_13505 [Spirochaetes bacterium GWE1_32_154]OHD49980.1 MAG: hypothetical protein A2Y29_11550 [Spirochaetes bacterium GWE2_31_10]OHD52296.1 MAG: hypothetical protein A2015_16135 [Spirochaetes bacterium GWF1_31_7]OHD83368.1 MAG: hypothetical protein A2355_18295 [Spirochaetes bacterium RIFOXYB1_FULL_32_8]HBD95291.1 hypothetical protein [Spirochaetia bacterium]